MDIEHAMEMAEKMGQRVAEDRLNFLLECYGEAPMRPDEEAANARNREIMEQIKKNVECVARWTQAAARLNAEQQQAFRDWTLGEQESIQNQTLLERIEGWKAPSSVIPLFNPAAGGYDLCRFSHDVWLKVEEASHLVKKLLEETGEELSMKDAIQSAAVLAGCAPEDLCSYLLALGIGSLTR